MSFHIAQYGSWYIYYDPPPIPIRSHDYCGVHKDYDPTPWHSDDPPSDDRRLFGGSILEVVNEIRAYEKEHSDAV